MLKHVKVIHTQATPTPHKCPHCDKACRIPFQRRHIRQAHTGVRPFTCDQCAKGFAVKSALTLHLKTSHGVVPEKTDRLPRSKKDAFRTTRSSPRGKKSVTTTPETLALSLGRIDSPIKKSYPSSSDNEKPELGDKDYVPKTENEVPVKPSSVEGVKLIPCLEPSCTPTFRTPLHERSHTGEKPEKCSLCEAAFAKKMTLQRHMIRDHSSTISTAQNTCLICGKRFHLRCDLNLHLDQHEGRYQVKCDTCGLMFLNAKTLLAHGDKMHGKDLIICDEYGRSFTSTQTLQEHKRIHTAVKKHKCETCGARFRRADVLTKHILTHTDERPYPCPNCKKVFKAKADLLRHVKVVHTQATSLPPRTNVPTAMKNVKPLPSDVTSAKRTQECGPSPATSEQKDSRSSRR
ncbi:Zinc finger protein 93 [Folsomia candida]|uniref:Zinc finger protein 93 n=1 Tax=Folsomia candida TaxID=158441 RepID=A0A226D0P6_FOLCA|nr:Zinc finger protein 93 [Folsomia candida]